ncbi:MAG: rRNA m2A2503 methyltransferase [Clostridium sp.]|nr:rRNA m2A2503 methyltransferase [Clostridium sp.]
MINILDFDLNDLKIWMKENGEKEFRAKQIFNWIYNEIWDFK